MRNKVGLKNIWYGLGENALFHGNLLYDSQKWEKAYKINYIYGATYPRALTNTKYQVKA